MDLDPAELEDVAKGEIRAMSPEEYNRAVVSSGFSYGEGLEMLGLIILFGGWISAGMAAIVAGIAVALISGDWARFVMVALGGTVLGYLAEVAAMFTFGYLDVRWLRTGRPDEAWFAILLVLGPAVALLVAVLVLMDV